MLSRHLPQASVASTVEQLEDRRLCSFSYQTRHDRRRLSVDYSNGPVSALTAAVLRFVSHSPGGFNPDSPPIE